jgi:Flp pilus assembly pilin Flp
MRRWSTFLRDENGTAAVEYSIVLGFIITVVIVAIAAFGQGQSGSWNGINGKMSSHGL